MIGKGSGPDVDPKGVGRERRTRAGDEAISDVEVLRSVIAVCAHLELPLQLEVLLQRIVSWCDADSGFAFGLEDEKASYQVLASTLGPADPRRQAWAKVEASKLRPLMRRPETRLEGLGPLEDLSSGWPEPHPKSSLALAVHGGGDAPIALLVVVEPRRLDTALTERILPLLRHVRQAVANAVQVRSVRDLVIKDDTAECYNRRYFDEFLPEELSRAGRFRSPVSLIFFDMDNLKAVNSRWGHAMGSQTLLEVSRRVRAKIRKFDKLFRFGGDEFCIVLPETEWHGALEVAERVREAIAGRNFAVSNGEEEGSLQMTASFGIASFPLHARSRDELIRRADRAMQGVKGSSKNSIAVAEIPEPGDGGVP